MFQHDGIWRLWCYCLMKAAHKDRQVLIGTTVVNLKRGQFVTGRESLLQDCYPTERGDEVRVPGLERMKRVSSKTLWRWLKILTDLGNVSVLVSSRFSIVTINNYESYNDAENDNVQASVQQMSSRCPADVHKEECKELKEERESAGLRLNGVILPKPFETQEVHELLESWMAYCDKRGKGPIDPAEQAARGLMLFNTVDDLRDSLNYAMGNGFTTLKNYAAQERAKSPWSEQDRSKSSMDNIVWGN